MPLRYLARRLRVPATAALQRAAGPRLLASRSPQNGEAQRRAMHGNGTKDLGKIRKDAMWEWDYEEASRNMKMLTKVSLLSAALGIALGPCAGVLLFGHLERGNKRSA